MKKYCYFFGLLVIHPLISARRSSLTTSGKNSNHSSPPLELTKHTQAVTPKFQTAPEKTYKRNITDYLGLFWLWFMARFYATEKSSRILEWQLEDLALLKIIKTKTLRLWNKRYPYGKIIRLEKQKY